MLNPSFVWAERTQTGRAPQGPAVATASAAASARSIARLGSTSWPMWAATLATARLYQRMLEVMPYARDFKVLAFLRILMAVSFHYMWPAEGPKKTPKYLPVYAKVAGEMRGNIEMSLLRMSLIAMG